METRAVRVQSPDGPSIDLKDEDTFKKNLHMELGKPEVPDSSLHAWTGLTISVSGTGTCTAQPY
jgi:hypothetical protein